jgi:ferritin-like metal-binding protein YciE
VKCRAEGINTQSNETHNHKEASVPDVKARDAKLIQYLNEAHVKERQLEQALEAHIAMTELATYRKRLQQHLTETKRHAREVERRIKQLGGEAEGITGIVQGAAGRVQSAAARGAALAQGQVHMVRGTSEQEKMLKNAKTEFQSEAEEIGTYTSIETLAKLVGDRDTQQLAKAILREEKRMAGFLEKLIPRLTQAVAKAEIPASERNGGRGRRTSSRRKSTRRTGGTARARTTSRSGSSRSTSRSSGASRSASRSGTSGRTKARSGSARSGASRSGGSRRTGARKPSSSGARKTSSSAARSK